MASIELIRLLLREWLFAAAFTGLGDPPWNCEKDETAMSPKSGDIGWEERLSKPGLSWSMTAQQGFKFIMQLDIPEGPNSDALVPNFSPLSFSANLPLPGLLGLVGDVAYC